MNKSKVYSTGRPTSFSMRADRSEFEHLKLAKHDFVKWETDKMSADIAQQVAPNTDYMVHSSSISLLSAQNRARILSQGKGYRSYVDYIYIKTEQSKLEYMIKEALSKTANNLLPKGEEYNPRSADADVNPIEDRTWEVIYNNEIIAYLRCSIVDHLETFVICIKIVLSGEQTFADQFNLHFKTVVSANQSNTKSSLVKWVYSSGSSTNSARFYMEKEREVLNEFYPLIKEGLHEYYKKFFESEAQILVLYGPPGTGKTSFIRDMICELGINATISYDMSVLASDSAFVSYMTDENTNAIIIEDADELLTSERGDHNKIIAKLLNVSDGLIKLPMKKLILTTNLTSAGDIDPAIIRRGRCFDVLHFPPLTREQAIVVANVTGKEIAADGNSFTLAEIFDDGHESHRVMKKKTIGFNQ